MRTSLFAIMLVPLLAACVGVRQDKGAGVKFRGAPLAMVLSDYSEKSGKSIEVVAGVDGVFSFASEEPLGIKEYFSYLEDRLKEANIGLFPISEKRLVATWIDPSKVPVRATSVDRGNGPAGVSSPADSYIKRLQKRRSEKRSETERSEPLPRISDDELRKGLQD